MYFDTPRERDTDSVAGGEPTTFTDRVTSSFDGVLKTGNFLSREWGMDDAYERRNKAIRDAGLGDLPNPMRSQSVAPDGKIIQRGIASAPETGDPHDEYQRMLDALELKHPDRKDIIRASKPVRHEVADIARQAEERSNDVQRRYGGNAIGGHVADFIGGMAAQAYDPVNAATLLLGPMGHAGRGAKGLLTMAAKQAAANATVEAAMQPKVQMWRKELGLEYGWGPGAESVLMAGAFGFAADAGIRGVYRGGQWAASRKPIVDAQGRVTGYEPLSAAEQRQRDTEAADRAAKIVKAYDEFQKKGAAATSADVLDAVRATGADADPAVRGAATDIALNPDRPQLDGIEDGSRARAAAQALRAMTDPDEPMPARVDTMRDARSPDITDRADLPKGTDGNQHYRSIVIDDKPVTVRSIDPAEVRTDAGTFQFKRGGDDNGVTNKLFNVGFDERAAGRVVAFERADGTLVIVDGHQRLALAQRTEPTPKLDALVFREADGWTPETVRAHGAQKNIQEGTGSLIDVARAFREHPGIVDSRLPLDTEFMRQARALAHLGDSAFDRVAGGEVDPNFAAMVPDLVADKGRHAEAIAALIDHAPQTDRDARVAIGNVIRNPYDATTHAMVMGLQDRFAYAGERADLLGDILGTLRQEPGYIADIETVAIARVIKHLSQKPDSFVAVTLDRAAQSIGEGQPRERVLEATLRRIEDKINAGGVKGLADDAVTLASIAHDIPAGRSMRADLDKLGYYSKALEAAKALKQDKGTPEQMLAMLKAAGVKEAEIEATQLGAFLRGDLNPVHTPLPGEDPMSVTHKGFARKGVVTKADIISHLERHRVDVREVTRGGPQDILDAEAQRNFGKPWSELSPHDQTDIVRMINKYADETKWSSYSLDPSNPTYRETVLHVPSQQMAMWRDEMKRQFPNEFAEYAPLMDMPPPSRSPVQQVEFERLRDFFQDNMDTSKVVEVPVFRSGHFPEKNVIAHLRTSMQKTADGRPVYHIDELQSDWGQNLRDGGVRDEKKIAELKAKSDAADAAFLAAEKAAQDVVKKLEGGIFSRKPSTDEIARLQDAASAAGATARRLRAELATAEASASGHPLVNTTDQWTNTAMRRAIRQAVEADADFIAIPSGKTVEAYGMGGKIEGLEYAYDTMYPKNMRNLLQKMDKSIQGEKVDHVYSPVDGKVSDRSKGHTLFPLTDEVKRKVMDEGQPLFATKGDGKKPTPDAARIAEFEANIKSVLDDAQTPPVRLVDDVFGKDGKAQLDALKQEMEEDIKLAMAPPIVDDKITSVGYDGPRIEALITPEEADATRAAVTRTTGSAGGQDRLGSIDTANEQPGRVERTGYSKDGARDGKHPEDFAVPGYRGRVIDITRPGVDRRRYYFIFDKNATVSDRLAGRAAFNHISAMKNWVARAELVEKEPGRWMFEGVRVRKDQRGHGVGTLFYDKIEADLGGPVEPSGLLTNDGYRFRLNRDPDSVKWHRRVGEMWLSPKQLLNWKVVLSRAAESSDNVSEIARLMTENKHIDAAITSLPLEAFAPENINAMFSLSKKQAEQASAARDAVRQMRQEAVDKHQQVTGGRTPIQYDSYLARDADHLVKDVRSFEDHMWKDGASAGEIAAAISERYGVTVDPADIVKKNVWWHVADTRERVETSGLGSVEITRSWNPYAENNVYSARAQTDVDAKPMTAQRGAGKMTGGEESSPRVGRDLSPEQRAQAVEMHRRGMGAAKIAEEMAHKTGHYVRVQTVINEIDAHAKKQMMAAKHRARAVPAARVWTREATAELRQALAEGVSVSDAAARVAAKTGREVSTTSAYTKLWSMRQTGEKVQIRAQGSWLHEGKFQWTDAAVAHLTRDDVAKLPAKDAAAALAAEFGGELTANAVRMKRSKLNRATSAPPDATTLASVYGQYLENGKQVADALMPGSGRMIEQFVQANPEIAARIAEALRIPERAAEAAQMIQQAVPAFDSPRILDFSKPAIYTPEANARMREIRQAIDDTVKMLPPDVRIRVEDRIVFNLSGRDRDFNALWDGYDRLIYVALQGGDPVRAVRHEVIHALRSSGLLDDADFKALYAFAETLKLRNAYATDARYKALYTERYGHRGADYVENLLREEVVADMFADYSLNGRRFGDVEGGGLIDRLIDKVVSFMKQLRDALGFLGYKDIHQIFERIESGDMARRGAAEMDVSTAMTPKEVALPGGGKVAGIHLNQLADTLNQYLAAIKAYHGSPHDFDRFDSAHIGKGEGAQAYGHGLYFADGEEVAKGYKERLGGGQRAPGSPIGRGGFLVAGEEIPHGQSGHMALDTAIEIEGLLQHIKQQQTPLWPGHEKTSQASIDYLRSVIENRIARHRSTKEEHRTGTAWRDMEALAEFYDRRLRNLSPDQIVERRGGRLYEVRINAEPEQFLDWDKPLSQQSEKVRQALAPIISAKEWELVDPAGLGAPLRFVDEQLARDTAAARPSRILNEVEPSIPQFAGDPRNARALREAGIPGIRYLDQGSRSDGKGTHNYVVFAGNDHLIEIVKKDGNDIMASFAGERAKTADHAALVQANKMEVEGRPRDAQMFPAELAAIARDREMIDIAGACRP